MSVTEILQELFRSRKCSSITAELQKVKVFGWGTGRDLLRSASLFKDLRRGKFSKVQWISCGNQVWRYFLSMVSEKGGKAARLGLRQQLLHLLQQHSGSSAVDLSFCLSTERNDKKLSSLVYWRLVLLLKMTVWLLIYIYEHGVYIPIWGMKVSVSVLTAVTELLTSKRPLGRKACVNNLLQHINAFRSWKY